MYWGAREFNSWNYGTKCKASHTIRGLGAPYCISHFDGNKQVSVLSIISITSALKKIIAI